MQNTYFKNLKSSLFNEKRSASSDWIYKNFFSDVFGYNTSGEVVTVDTGSKISTVFTCINAISQDIAKLPFSVYRSKNGVKSINEEHPVHDLIHSKPSDHVGAFNFWYSIVFSMLRKGNGIAVINRNGLYEPDSLTFIEWDKVKMLSAGGDVFYEVRGEGTYPARDILHFKMYTLDGLTGVSPITWNASLMGYKLKQDRYSAAAIGTKGSGFISSEGLTASQGKELATSLKASIKNGTIPFLGTKGQTKWNQQIITPNEAQYIETKTQTNTEIYGIYRFPPAFAQNYERATFSNAEQQDLVYVKHTLTPWVKLIEQECDRKLFKEKSSSASIKNFTKFNLNGVLRGDIKSRKEFYQTMITSGIMNADEVREKEDLPPQPDGIGAKYYIQGAMIEKGTNNTIEQ